MCNFKICSNVKNEPNKPKPVFSHHVSPLWGKGSARGNYLLIIDCPNWGPYSRGDILSCKAGMSLLIN